MVDTTIAVEIKYYDANGLLVRSEVSVGAKYKQEFEHFPNGRIRVYTFTA